MNIKKIAEIRAANNFLLLLPKKIGIDNNKLNHAALEAVRTIVTAIDIRNKKINKPLKFDFLFFRNSARQKGHTKHSQLPK